mmetsp:Transcript_49955/g.95428  ORF Transcript_49955/g.95428 Transcript_49955/m.95428 type:complete len:201 (-) Transcript_49955:127-729(-)
MLLGGVVVLHEVEYLVIQEFDNRQARPPTQRGARSRRDTGPSRNGSLENVLWFRTPRRPLGRLQLLPLLAHGHLVIHVHVYENVSLAAHHGVLELGRVCRHAKRRRSKLRFHVGRVHRTGKLAQEAVVEPAVPAARPHAQQGLHLQVLLLGQTHHPMPTASAELRRSPAVCWSPVPSLAFPLAFAFALASLLRLHVSHAL